MAVVVFDILATPAAPLVYQRGATNGGLQRLILGVPAAALFTYRYQARRSSDNATIQWSSDGPDPTGIRAGTALVAGSITRLA